jgi:hypothetical protein
MQYTTRFWEIWYPENYTNVSGTMTRNTIESEFRMANNTEVLDILDLSDWSFIILDSETVYQFIPA